MDRDARARLQGGGNGILDPWISPRINPTHPSLLEHADNSHPHALRLARESTVVATPRREVQEVPPEAAVYKRRDAHCWALPEGACRRCRPSGRAVLSWRCLAACRSTWPRAWVGICVAARWSRPCRSSIRPICLACREVDQGTKQRRQRGLPFPGPPRDETKPCGVAPRSCASTRRSGPLP